MDNIIKNNKINRLRKGLLILMTIILTILSLSLGVEKLSWIDIFDKTSFSYFILINSRLPRTISVLLAGFGISIAGLIFQKISQNKFVSPTTAGSVSGAQLGIALTFVFLPSKSTMVMMIFAFIMSLVVSSVFMGILSKLKFKELIYVPLLGIMLGSLINSITTFIAYRYNFLQALQGWFYGSFSLITSGRYELIYLIVGSLVVAFLYAKSFTIASVGESFATNLGLNYKVIVNIGVIITSLVSAVVVIVVGSIPFLGLVVPNIVSMYLGDHLEKNLIDVGLMGMIILLVCDVLSRIIIFPYELPIALIVGVLGATVFFIMLIGKGGKRK